MKDAARLLAYFATVILFGALCAPFLCWIAQWLAARGVFPALAQFDFESFFHRAILLGAILFIWPLLRWLGIKNFRALGLLPNKRWLGDAVVGFLISAMPLLCCGILLVMCHLYSLRVTVEWTALSTVIAAAAVVPLIEETLFRGLFLGVLLRSFRPIAATVLSAGIFSIVHFLKAPGETTTSVNWNSGFVSLVHSFDQFTDPMLLLGSFTTLFLIGLILADARNRTRSLWLPIGLHAGWIFANGLFNKITRREILALPWVGKSLLVGIVPLSVGLLSWGLLRVWWRYVSTRDA
ncbi:MAG TPA: CPBP family intramembrane glutamic endopeptidase [Chthoniobacterales bacterium]